MLSEVLEAGFGLVIGSGKNFTGVVSNGVEECAEGHKVVAAHDEQGTAAVGIDFFYSFQGAGCPDI